jgi:23S rRNA (cytosine1962-C5)-methyltransferase
MKINLVFNYLNALLPSTCAKRLLHGRGGLVKGFEQINIEVYSKVLWVIIYQQVDEQALLEVLSLAKDNMDKWNIDHIYIQRRFTQGNPVEVYAGTDMYLDSEFEVKEGNLKYLVRLGRNQNTGLFLDMCNGRKWLAQNSEKKSVLNLFSYTCSLGVSAASGGARQVVNIDMAKAAVKKGQQNFAINNCTGTFLAQDIFKMVKRLNQKGPFDILVADPPSFQLNAFEVQKDYKKLLIKLKPSLADDAILMLCLNSPVLDTQFIHDMVEQVFENAMFIKRLENPEVLADVNEQASLKVMLYQLE